MNYCKACLMPDTRPDTEFVDGECSACISYRARADIDWDERENKFHQLFHEARKIPGINPDVDCIIPASGGKDSHAQLMKVLEHGYRPLVVVAQTCDETWLGRANIENMARYAPTVVVQRDPLVRRKLNRMGMLKVGDISWPEHVAIFTVPFYASVQWRIPLVFYGENPQNQYGGPLSSAGAMEMTARWRSEFGGFLGLRPSDFVGKEGLTERDMQMYEFPELSALMTVGTQAHFLGQYFAWDSHQNAELAVRMGMQTWEAPPCHANVWVEENLDNYHTLIHDLFMYRKYGYTRGQAQLSVDIRAGRISREDAVKALNDTVREPLHYLGKSAYDMLDDIEVAREVAFRTLDKFTNWDIFRRVVVDEPPMLLDRP